MSAQDSTQQRSRITRRAVVVALLAATAATGAVFLLLVVIVIVLNSFERATSEKRIEVFLQVWSSSWVTFEHDLTRLVNKHDVGHTLHLVDLAAVRFGSVVVDIVLLVFLTIIFFILANAVSVRGPVK